MAPNSRPPLTSRIRASFEGRRKSFDGSRKLSKSGRATTSDSNNVSQEDRISAGIDSDINSPLHTNGFVAPDPESIRNAVDLAINGEAFQTAIAANLAKLIKPSIKSALDTIQPIVEAVYSHELLLRKTNQSVEDVLSRMDTNAETAAARRTSMIDTTYVVPGSPADGERSSDAGVEGATSKELAGPDFNQFRQMLEDQNTKTLATIYECMESSNTKLGELSQGLSEVTDSIRPTTESINSVKSTSEQATTTISVLQAQFDQLQADIGQIIEAIGTDLGKNIQTISEKSGAAPDVELLSSHTTKLDQITTDLAALKGHEETTSKIDAISSELGVLKASVEAGTTASAQGFTEILAAVGDHATVLNEIKEKEPHPEILAALQQSNDSHVLHTAALSEIKERSLGPVPAPVVSDGGNVDHSSALDKIQTDLTVLTENVNAGFLANGDFGAKVDKVLTAIEEQKLADSSVEILAAVKQSNEFHAAHTTALEGLKSGGADLGPELGAQITGIVSKLDDHSATLEEIKAFGGTHTAALEGIKSVPSESAAVDSNELAAQIAAVIAKLETHTSVLEEIKAVGGTHTAALEGIKPVPSESNAVDSNELAAQITAVIAKLETHTTALEEIKAVGSTPVESKSLDTDDLATQISTIATKLDTHAATLDEIKGLGSTHATALEGHGVALESIKAVPADNAFAGTEDLANQVTALAAKLDSHTVALDEIKGISGSHATALEGIKSVGPEPITTQDTGDLSAQITTIVSKLDLHTSVLDEIKGISGSHATALEGVKSAGPEPIPTQDTGDLSAQITTIVSKLDEHTSVLNELKGFSGSHVTALENHGIALDSIKALSANVPGDSIDSEIASQITAVVDILGKHSAALDEIKAHTTTLPSHASALEEIKTSTSAHTTALENHGAAIESVRSLSASSSAESSNTASESQISNIIATLESHGSVLDEIKTSTGTHSTALESHKTVLDEIKTSTGTHSTALESHGSTLESLKDLIASSPAESDAPALEAKFGAIISTLESHSAALDDIKATGGSHTSVLDEIKTFGTAHATALESHGTSIEDIKSRSLERPPAAVESAPLDTHMTNLITTLESHTSALDEIRASTGSHSLVLGELKIASTIHADALEDIKSPVIPPVAASDPSNLAALEIQIGSIISTLETHSAAWNEIKARESTSLAVVPTESEKDSETSDEPLTSIIETLKVHTHLLNEIKEDVSAEILTALHDMGQIQANQSNLLTEIREADLADEILTLLHASSESQISHASALDKIHAAVVVSNDSHIEHASSLNEIKSRSIEAATPSGEAPDIGDLKEKISDIAGKLEEYSVTLSAIKEATDISNRSHAAHASLLGEIHSKSANGPTDNGNLHDLESQIGGIVSKLDDHTAVLSSIKDVTSESNDSHMAHAAAIAFIKDKTASILDSHASQTVVLNEIKDTALASKDLHSSNATSLLELKDATSSFHDKHSATMSEIRDATLASKDAHSSHTAAFSELKSLQPSAALEPAIVDLSGLEANITSVLTTLEGQTTTLSSIKEGTTIPSSEILTAIQASHDLLTTHGPLLESIKEGNSNTSILSNISELKAILEESKAETASHGALVKDLHSETKDSHSNLASAIGALALGGAAGAGATTRLSQDDDSNSDVLEEVKAVRTLLETSATNVEDTKNKVSSLASQIEANHAAITANVSTLGDDIRSEINASSTGVVESINGLHGDVKAIDASLLPALSTSLSQHGTELKDLSNQIESLEASVKESSTYIAILHNGVHFNDTGVQQLKDHVVPRSTPLATKEQSGMAEGAWFGSARSGSRSPTLSRVVSRSLVEPVPEVVEQVSPPIEVADVGSKYAAEPEHLEEEQVGPREIPDSPEAEGTVEADSIAEPVAISKAVTPEPLSEIIREPTSKSEVGADISLTSKDIEETEATLGSPPIEEVAQPEHLLEKDHADESSKVESAEQAALPHVPTAKKSVVDDLEQSTHHVLESEVNLPDAIFSSPNVTFQADDIAPQPQAIEHDSFQKPQDASMPQSTHEIPEASSPFIESPEIARDLDGHFANSSSVLRPAHQSLIDDQSLDPGHATPRDEARSNPFDDSDNMMSPSSVFSPQSVLSPEDEIDVPVFPVHGRMDSLDEHGLALPDSDSFAPQPTFPVALGTNYSEAQRYAEDSDRVASPSSEYRVPLSSDGRPRTPVFTNEHEATFAPRPSAPGLSDLSPRTPVQAAEPSNFPSPDIDTFAPPPSFPSLPAATLHTPQRFDDSDDVMSPSSEYDDPRVSDIRQRTSLQDQPFDSPAFTPAPSIPVFPEPTQHSSQPRYEDSDDPMTPASQYDAHGLPHMTLESPFQSRPFETSHLPSSPQFDHPSSFQPRRLQHESSFEYQSENYEPALLPRYHGGEAHALDFDDSQYTSYGGFGGSDIRDRSPLRPLEDGDLRARQYERYSPEPVDLQQRSSIEALNSDERSVANSGFPAARARSPVQHEESYDYQSSPPQRYSPESEPSVIHHRQGSPVDTEHFDDHSQRETASPFARQTSLIQPLEDDDIPRRSHQQYSPEPESSFAAHRQYSPKNTPPSIASLPPHLQLNTPAFRSASPVDPYDERDAEAVSPSSEFAVPLTPALPTQTVASTSRDPVLPSTNLHNDDEEEPSHKGKAIASPALMSPELGSPAEFGFNRNEVESEVDSALASPTSPLSPASPAFSEGGTMVEKSGGKKKKGKKEKKEKAGGKKGKKEKVPFEMDGEDAE
ncbi:hypothetical protein VTL71DRAFT_8893 [Oculimacula yallundae]|uniref:Uncharacterized protein n=1 Tax=Oculimacula yallundae TaxID=86028 RepID=A0ABR4BUP7_9HELO